MTDDVIDKSSKHLWCAVIDTALIDAALPLGNDRKIRREREDARNWLTVRNRDFIYVCGLAGIEPDNVRNAALKIIAKASLHDSPPPAAKPKQARLLPNTQYEHHGRSLTIIQWAAQTGINHNTIRSRLRRGLAIGEALAGSSAKAPGVASTLSRTPSHRPFSLVQDISSPEFPS